MNEGDRQLVQSMIQQELAKSSWQNQFNTVNVPRHIHNGQDSPKIPASNIVASPRTGGNVTMSTAQQIYNFYLNQSFTPSLILFYGGAFHNSLGSQVITNTTGLRPAGSTGATLASPWAGSTAMYSTFFYTAQGGGDTISVNYTNNSTAITWSGGLNANQTSTELIVTTAAGSIDNRATIQGTACLGNEVSLQPYNHTSVRLGIPYLTNPANEISTIPPYPILQSSAGFMVDNSGNVHVTSTEQHIVNASTTADSSGIVARATVVSFSNNLIQVYTDVLASGWTIQGNWVIL